MTRAACVLVLVAATGIAPPVAAPSASERPRLDGTWTWTWTRAALQRIGERGADLERDAGDWTTTLAGGRFETRNLTNGRVVRGSYTVHGDVVGFTLDRDFGDLVAGRAYPMRFSLYRGRVTFRHLPGRGRSLHVLTLAPWTRVG